MKKIFTLILILALGQIALTASAKGTSPDDIFTEFSSEKDAEYVNVNSFMMWLGKQFAGDGADADIVKKIKSVRVLDLEDCSATVKSRFSKRINEINDSGYEEMIRVNDNGERVRILARKTGDVINRMLIVCASADDCALVEVNGKFTMDDITGVVNSQTGKKNGRR